MFSQTNIIAFFLTILVCFLIFNLNFGIKYEKEMFSLENFKKSYSAIIVLGAILTLFIFLLINI